MTERKIKSMALVYREDSNPHIQLEVEIDEEDEDDNFDENHGHVSLSTQREIVRDTCTERVDFFAQLSV